MDRHSWREVENSVGIARPVNVIVVRSKIHLKHGHAIENTTRCTKLFGCRVTSGRWKEASRTWLERHSQRKETAPTVMQFHQEGRSLLLVYCDLPLHRGRKRVPPLSEIIVEFLHDHAQPKGWREARRDFH